MKPTLSDLDQEEVVVTGNLHMDIRRKLKEQRSEDTFCDAVLQVNGAITRAHRCVLGAATPVFYTMFYGEFKEKRQQMVDLSEAFTSVSMLDRIINFIYGHELVVTEDVVSDLLRGANFLMIEEITELCLKFMLKALNLDNCLWIMTLAELYSLRELKEVCFDLACSRFHDCLIKTKDALKLPPEYLKNYIENGMADHCSEAEIMSFLEKFFGNDSHIEEINYIMETVRKSKLKSRKTRFASNHTADNEKFNITPCYLYSVESDEELENLQDEEYDSFSENENSETEIFMFILSDKYALFCPATSKWYEVLPLDDSSINRNEERIEAVGIGEERDLILLTSGNSMTLINVFTEQKYEVPVLPKKKLEATAESVERENLLPFCSLSQLYCLYRSRISDVFEGIETRHGYVNAFYLQRFDFRKWKWELVSLVHQDEEENLAVKLLFHGHGNVYIFIIGTQRIKLFKFSSLTNNVIQLRSARTSCLELKSMHRNEIWVAGSKSTLTIASEVSKKRVLYNIKQNSWSTRYNFPDNPSVRSHTRNEFYYLSKGSVESIVHMNSLDLVSDFVKELPTLPGMTLRSPVYLLRAPKCLLEKLHYPEVYPEFHKPVCNQNEIDNMITQFKNKKYPDKKLEEDSDVIDIDDDVMQRAKEQILLMLLSECLQENDDYDIYNPYDPHGYDIYG